MTKASTRCVNHDHHDWSNENFWQIIVEILEIPINRDWAHLLGSQKTTYHPKGDQPPAHPPLKDYCLEWTKPHSHAFVVHVIPFLHKAQFLSTLPLIWLPYATLMFWQIWWKTISHPFHELPGYLKNVSYWPEYLMKITLAMTSTCIPLFMFENQLCVSNQLDAELLFVAASSSFVGKPVNRIAFLKACMTRGQKP